jgi:hypothetical protein
MIESEYVVSFTFAGRDSTYRLDTRRLSCQGIPKKFDDELVVENRLRHMPKILEYIKSRSRSSKQNAFSNLKGYLLWCENERKAEFTLTSFEEYSLTEKSQSRLKEVRRIHRVIGILPTEPKKIKRQKVTRATTVKKQPPSDAPIEPKREGILSATDGSHVIVFNTRSKGILRKNVTSHIKHLQDKNRQFNALRELLNEASGDTFIDYLDTYCDYASFAKNNFFDANNLQRYFSKQKNIVSTKSKGANLSRRKLRRIIRLFNIAEEPVPAHILHAASKLPAPRSTPVEGYDQKRYRELIKLLFKRFHQAYAYLSSSNPRQDMFSDEVTALNTLMNSAYFLIARYSAWTDSTIKNINKNDVVFDNKDGEWVYFSGTKMRGGKKKLEIDMPGESKKIKKTGYSIIKTLLELHKKYEINHEQILFSVTAKGKPTFFARNQSFQKEILNAIHGLGSLNTQRIRETEISISHTRDGLVGAIKRSGSSANVVKRHYSEGSSAEHKSQLGAIAVTMHDIAKAKGDLTSVQNIKKQLYGKYSIPISQDISAKSNTPIGTRCTTPSTKDTFPKKAEKLGFGQLACADLIACFECKSAALIDSVDDIWNLISFKERLNNGKLFSVDREHHAKNFNEVIARIEIVLEQFAPENVQQAERKLITEGSHPFWNEDDLF